MAISNPEYSHSKILRPIKIDSGNMPLKDNLPVLMLAAMGVVFGDIGTSPLYAFKACFNQVYGAQFSHLSVYGILSAIFWALLLVVSLKYMLFVMRTNNQGEGGILALMTMALRTATSGSRRSLVIMLLGVFGACMFYGDVVITPAISVLSAVEGLKIVSPRFMPYVLPTAVSILVILFAIQRKGTAIVGFLFGPLMAIWFLVLGSIGIYHIIENPSVLWAINPIYAAKFILAHPKQTFIVFGAVFLVLTGAETMYADMGHFGMKPIRYLWFFVVMPCLLINYFGQGAMLLHHPEALGNPFFHMVSEAYILPLVILATLATIIASQAVISGAYSMTSQAILLGLLPRMKVVYTSAKKIGQIYMPTVNWLLLAAVITVIFLFRQSANLTAAYGIAVSATMVVTTILSAIVMYAVWKWHKYVVMGLIGVFIFIDIAFFISNTFKIPQGGWFTLSLGCFCFLLFVTWYQGRNILRRKIIAKGMPIDKFIKLLEQRPVIRIDGVAVFIAAHVDYVPVAMLRNLKHNQVMHERVIFLKISIWDVPYVKDSDRLHFKDVGHGIYLARAVYGFKQTPDMHKILDLLESQYQFKCDLNETSFFLARDIIVTAKTPGMATWRKKLFTWMLHNATKPSDFFHIPKNRVVELGAKITI